MYEFFWTTDKNRLMVHDLEEDRYFPLTPDEEQLIDQCADKICDDYPATWQRLIEEYPSKELPISRKVKFQRVNRFLKCNFSVHDNYPDIDDDWNFELERVPCPLRGECTRGHCTPRLTSKLTEREVEIIRYHVEGLTQEETGELLHISGATVKNHIYKIYKKLSFTGRTHPEKLLINYAYKHQLIK